MKGNLSKKRAFTNTKEYCDYLFKDYVIPESIARKTYVKEIANSAYNAALDSAQKSWDLHDQPYIDEAAQTAETTAKAYADEKSAAAEQNAKTYTDEIAAEKVDKVEGKGLSTEDYTTAEKTKLSELPTNAKLESARVGKKISGGGEIFNIYEFDINKATGASSHAEGCGASASGDCSHAEGYNVSASGDYSHAQGYGTYATGSYSHAEGYETIASGSMQHVQGQYNVEDTQNKYAHIVGNGLGNGSNSNAHTLDWNGVGWFQSSVKVGGTGQDDTSAKTLATEDYTDVKSAAVQANAQTYANTAEQNAKNYVDGRLDKEFELLAEVEITETGISNVTVKKDQNNQDLRLKKIFVDCTLAPIDDNEEGSTTYQSGQFSVALFLDNSNSWSFWSLTNAAWKVGTTNYVPLYYWIENKKPMGVMCTATPATYNAAAMGFPVNASRYSEAAEVITGISLNVGSSTLPDMPVGTKFKVWGVRE